MAADQKPFDVLIDICLFIYLVFFHIAARARSIKCLLMLCRQIASNVDWPFTLHFVNDNWLYGEGFTGENIQ